MDEDSVPHDPSRQDEPENGDRNMNASLRTYPEYPKSGNGGVAIIISNKFADNDQLEERIGADVDRDMMKDLLIKMGFKDIHGEDKEYTVEDMKDLFEKVSNIDFTNKDCFACVILSYGDEEGICTKGMEGQESEVEVNTLLDVIKRVKSLAGKPKLCFIQTCPHKPKFYGEGQPETGGIPFNVRKLPVEADFLKVHSCIPGCYFWSRTKPSLFIECLNEVVRKNWTDVREHQKENLDIFTLMTRVSKDIAKKLSGMRDSDDKNARHRLKNAKIPYVSSTLTRELVLKEC